MNCNVNIAQEGFLKVTFWFQETRVEKQILRLLTFILKGGPSVRKPNSERDVVYRKAKLSEFN